MGVLSGFSVAYAQEAATGTISAGTRAVVTKIKVEKGGCYLWDVYVQGYVTSQNGLARVAGAVVTGTISTWDDVDFVWYFDHSSYNGGGCYYCHYPNGETTSRAVSDYYGFYELRFDLCIDDDADDWDADFSLCASKVGFATSCILSSFDEGDDFDERSFFLVSEVAPTVTVTSSPTLTPTPTPTLSLTPTPTLTSAPTPTMTHSGPPPAAYPEFDADQNGTIGPEDLFLFLKDWKHGAK
jgi:hypothetical protein